MNGRQAAAVQGRPSTMSNLFLLCILLATTSCRALHSPPPSEKSDPIGSVGTTLRWSNRLPYAPRQPGILPFAGTEIRALVAMGGSLYAANSYWRDTREDSKQLPGPQVLRLDAPSGEWVIDLQLDERMTSGPLAGLHRFQAIGALASAEFRSDGGGHALASPVTVLLASTWDRSGGLRLFSKAN